MSEISSIENGKVMLSISVSAADYRRALDSAYRRLSSRYPIQGFRNGKAPRKLIENTYGKDVFWDDEFYGLLQNAYSAAVTEHNIEPELQPTISYKTASDEEGLLFEATVVLHPEVVLGQYKGIEIPMQEYNVTVEAVDAELERRRRELARLVPSDAPIENGDTVEFDFAGYLDGELFDGGSAKNHSMVIGSHTFIPGFEEQMIGMRVDEERDLNVTFPEDYRAEHLAGKPVVFKVKVHAISREELPELNDDFAADISDFDTLEELRADIRRELEEKAADDRNNAFEAAVIQAAIDNATINIHPDIIHEEAHNELHQLTEQLERVGGDLESYAQYAGLTTSELHERYHKIAEEQLRARYVIQAIIDAEKLEPVDSDYETAVRAYAKRQTDWDEERITNELSEDNRRKYAQSALYEAVIRFMKENAVAVKKEDA